MKRLELAPGLAASIREAASAAYPEEGCGFLFATAAGIDATGTRRIVRVASAPNRSAAERRRRFVILPDELRAAEAHAAARDELVVGFFHSHPDHPPVPSEFDRAHAWPWYAYVLVGTGPSGATSPIRAYELDAERREFGEVPLSEVPGSDPLPRAAAP